MKIVHRGLMLGASIILLFALLVFVVYTVDLMRFPYDYDQGEGFELVDTMYFSEGRWPYQNTDAFPFYSSNYPPLFHVMLVPFAWFFGPAYWYGRLAGFVATLIAAATIGYAVYRDGSQKRWIAALAGLAFISSNFVYHIGPLFRQHITMVAFETVAIVLLAWAFPQRNRVGIGLALLLLVAAGYTKQLAAITALAALLWIFLRNPRRGLVWGAAFVTVGLAIFGWMNVSTHGEWWRQAIQANVNAFDALQAFYLARLWWQLHGFLIVPALLLVLYELYFERISLYSVWFVIAAVLGGIGSGTWGAGDSYFTSAIAAMCILSGVFFSRWLSSDWKPNPTVYQRFFAPLLRPAQSALPTAGLIIVPLLFAGYGVATFKLPTNAPLLRPIADLLRIEPNVDQQLYDSASHNVLGYAQIGHILTPEDRAAGDYIAALVANADGPVLSEEAGFSYAAGREVITNPTQLLNLWRAGLWDGTELIGMIENHEFALIILRAQFYPEPALVAIATHYEHSETVTMNGFNYQILRPRTTDSSGG